MADCYDVANVARAVGSFINSHSAAAGYSWPTCETVAIADWAATDGAFFGISPVSVRRNKVDRQGIQADYALELFYYQPENLQGGLVADDVFNTVENWLFQTPRITFTNSYGTTSVVFQKFVYDAETNIQNGGIIEGYYDAERLSNNGQQITSAMLYFSAWYKTTSDAQTAGG